MRKKKLNNKGYMLVEIILASVIAMSIAYYLLNITYKFKDKNEDVHYSTELISLKNNITKNIMNDLEGKTITDVNYDDKYNITFKSNDNQTKISFSTTENGKITKIQYGPFNDSTKEFITTDSSYYQKKFASYIEVGEPELKTFNSDYNGILTITIPISNIYDKNSYDIILTLKNENYPLDKRPIIVHYCLNGGSVEETSKAAIKDEIIYFNEDNHYLTPNNKETNDNILITRNANEYFSGWYVAAKDTPKENLYWYGCSEIQNNERCWSNKNGHGWHLKSDLDSHSYFLGEYYNHRVGYDFANEAASNVGEINVYELWLYACYTDENTTLEKINTDMYNDATNLENPNIYTIMNIRNSAYLKCNVNVSISTTECDNPNYPN